MKNFNFFFKAFILGLLGFSPLAFSIKASEVRDLHLRDQDLSWKKLSYKDYTNVDLRGVNFSHAILNNAKFVNAKLSKANFQYSDLTGADFTNACLNGAKFKGSKLLDTIFDEKPQARGTLIADQKKFRDQLKKEQKTVDIYQELTSSKHIFILKDSPRLIEIQEKIYQYLQQAQYRKKEYVAISFKNIKNEHRVKDCCESLIAPFFSNLVKEIDVLSTEMILVIHLNDRALGNSLKIIKKISDHFAKIPKLDLHGKIPLNIKRQQIDQFILTAHTRRISNIDIITGRGLHNPQGEMGILWESCQRYLLGKRFDSCIKSISAISLNGGWRLTLKNQVSNENNKGKKKLYLKDIKSTNH